ncbi:MAG TPA: alpha/beta fold hydrolase [Thermoanaerobaculia bacterium]|nr:alpha/beta fold hydrolase [Thermoanaerobaculia bacterium]
MAPTPFQLPGARPLVGYLDLPEDPSPAPVVVLCCGFKGFAEWGFFPPLAALLAERGLAAVRFHYRDTGMQLGDAMVTDLEAFRRQTISAELEDTRAVLAALPELAARRLDMSRVALYGHSRGGAVALLAAAEVEDGGGGEARSLRALVTWSAISHFDRVSAEELRQWRETGTWTAVNARTGQRLPIGLDLVHDVETNRERLDPLRAAARRRVPWLIVHGDRDETVPIAEGEALAAAAAPPAELRRVAQADHAFGVKTPFAGPNPQLIEALNATQTWLLRWLRA